LATLIFSVEFHRRSIAEDWGISSVAAHPGLARTDISPRKAGETRENRMPLLLRLIAPFLFQSAERGALPLLFAATSLKAQSGGYYGPDASRETRGYPAPAKIPIGAQDKAIANRLWNLSCQMAQIDF
jgi:hypothetical protein